MSGDGLLISRLLMGEKSRINMFKFSIHDQGYLEHRDCSLKYRANNSGAKQKNEIYGISISELYYKAKMYHT